MAYLNLKYGLLIYEDTDNTRNPDIRLPDISKQIEGVVVEYDKSERLSIYSNEIKDIATTQRSVAWDLTTQMQFLRPLSTKTLMRFQYTGTGTAPVFRTNRAVGGAADTEVTVSRLTDYVARIQNVAGTAWSLGGVAVNDFIRFESDTDTFTSPLAEANKGKQYLVQSVGADYIDFIDNGGASVESNTVLGADFSDVVKVISQGPVKVGDIIQISGSGINPSNRGKFEVLDVSDDYIVVDNPLGVPETFLYSTNSIVVFEYLIGFVHIRASGSVKIRFGDQTEWLQLDRLGSEAIFFGSACTHKIEAMNDQATPITISIQHAMVSR